MQRFSSVFKIHISPYEISIQRALINPFKFTNLFILIMFLILFIIFAFPGYYVLRLAYVKYDIVFLFDGIVILCLLSIISTSLIKWNYFSNYPSNVHISQGNISIQFRRLFITNDSINITSQDEPFLTLELLYRPQTTLLGMYGIWGKVTLHSLNTRSMVIYCQEQLAKEEAVNQSMQFAESVANRSGLIPKEKIYTHNR